MWNKLHSDLKNSTTVNMFKKGLSTFWLVRRTIPHSSRCVNFAVNWIRHFCTIYLDLSGSF